MENNMTELVDLVQDRSRCDCESIIEDLLSKPFLLRSLEEQLEVVKRDRPCPPLPNLIYQEKNIKHRRYFSNSYYKTVKWLAGCEKQSKVYCWPCLLFSKEHGVWNSVGFNHLKRLSVAKVKHERSQTHVHCFLQLKLFGQGNNYVSLDEKPKLTISETNKEVSRNRELFKRLVDVICYQITQELPSLASNSLNIDNFLELLSFLRTYDPVLDSHLKTSTVLQHIHTLIENEIIKAVADVIQDNIKNEVKSSTFVILMLSEMSSISVESRLFSILRFVIDGTIHERFIGFLNVDDDRSSSTIFNHIVNIVKEFDISKKLVGQTYDGATVKSSELNDLKNKVKEEYPLALFTHFNTHELNFILQQSLRHIKLCRIFFHTLNGLEAFFHKSTERIVALKGFVTRACPSLPSIAPTIWNFTSRLTQTVKEFRVHLIAFFEDLIEHCDAWDSDAIVSALGLVSFLYKFETILLLEVFSKIFSYTDDLYTILQTAHYDVSYCYEKVEEITRLLQYDREHDTFEEMWSNCLQVEVKDVSQAKKSYMLLYYEIIETISSQICIRYSAFTQLEFCNILSHKNFEQFKEKFPEGLMSKLMINYRALFDYTRLKNELTVLYSADEFVGKSLFQIVKILTNPKLSSVFSEVLKLAMLIMVMPCTTFDTECPFPAVKRIRSYCQDAPENFNADLSFLSIEKELVMELKYKGRFHDNVLQKFLQRETWMELNYK